MTRRTTRRAGTIGAALSLVAGLGLTSLPPLQPTAAAAQKIEAISCSTATGGTDDYPGDSSSKRYNDLFAPSHAIPQTLLNSFIPQGLGTWPNYGGKGKDLLVMTAYRRSDNVGVIIGLVPGGGVTKTVRLTSGSIGHAGGVAVVNGHLFVSAPGTAVQRFSLSTLRTKFRTGGTIAGATPQKVAADSFLGVYGTTLYGGQFTDKARSDTNKPKMYGYTVSASGSLKRTGPAIEVPVKTQGVVVTGSHFIYSTAYLSQNQGNIYVERRGYTSLDAAYPQDLTCFRSPSMAEGITRSNGRLYLTFEGGSYAYAGDPCDKPQPFEGDCTRNVIKNLHSASLASLQGLT